LASDTQDLGFIGIGNMGLEMTRRLLQRGWRVTVHDIDHARVEAAVALGARAASSAAEAAHGRSLVLVCVMYTEQVEELVFGRRGVAEGAARGAILLDHSTIDAGRSAAMAERLRRERRMGWIDAPVSGGPPSAADGTLAVFVGGEVADVERAQPVLRDLARQATHMGPNGHGLLTKMVNQMLVSACFATMAEAARFAERAGLDVRRVPEALAGGYADSLLLQRVWPKIVARGFVPAAGYAFQMLKDLDLVTGIAQGTKTPTPVTAQVQQLFRMLVSRGHGDVDVSGVFKLYDEGAV
jgi:3-hydroxyisobutyrate dehydrogenase-like beta-hydroxyacid dehydrogenase